MQSLLQYRRIRSHLESEIQHHGIDKVTRCVTPTVTSKAANQSPGDRFSRVLPPRVRDHAEEEAQLERSSPNEATLSTTTDGAIGLDKYRQDSTLTATDQDHPPEKAEKFPEDANASSDSSSTSGPEQGYETEADAEQAIPVERWGTRLGRLMGGITIQKHMSRKTEKDINGHIFVVGYDGPDDPLNPHNWSKMKRLICTVSIVSIAFIVSFASSIDSAAIPQAAREFGVSEVVESLATGLFLVGFGCGAFFAAPVSETIGRNAVYLGTGVVFMIFEMASALSPNIGAQLAFRFIGGFFGSTPLTCAGGSLSDMWNPTERTIMFPLFAFLSFMGPAAIGPMIGGFIAESSVISWRWVDWITLIWSGLIFGAVFLFMPETYTPLLLKWKAEHLRALTGDNRYKSEVEVRDETFWQRLLSALYRPWLMIIFEPILQLLTLYMSIVYIILFTFLTGFPYIFQETYNLSQGITFLIFLALGVGFTFTYAFTPYLGARYKHKLHKAQAAGKSTLPPEQRLFIAMISAPFLPIGIFWMAWTTYPSISVWSPIVACVLVGFGMLGIFIASYQYTIDSYEKFAASGLVGLTFVRYLVAGGMIPVSIPFYKNLGVHWTLTILGALSAIMVPVPYVFFIYGAKIRSKSKRAVQG